MERKVLFERGDIVLDLDRKDPRLILSISEDNKYEFMELKDQSWKNVFGTIITIHKGDINWQPIDIVESNFSIYNIK